MLTRLKRILYAIAATALLVSPIAAWSETIAIPVYLDYQQLLAHLMRDQFNTSDNAARYLLDDSGCADVTFSEPQMSAAGDLLRVDAKIRASIGVPAAGGCTVITRWTGRTAVFGKPLVVSGQPLSVAFKVQDARLYDQQDRMLTDSLVLSTLKDHLHLVLSRFMLDLKPEVNQLKQMLPLFLPRYSADRLTRMIDSLRIGDLAVRAQGLDAGLKIDVQTAAKAGPEPVLSDDEITQFEQKYRNWDAFLTFTIKEAAAATRSEKLRADLLEILIDARYQLKSVLTDSDQPATDPVKQLFVRSWARLMPLMRAISVQLPEQNLLPFLSFITAADALKALERLGPEVGLDISADGLRRLARLLNDDPTLDPLQYRNDIDPVLQQLFGLGIPGEISQPPKSYHFNFQLIRAAYAANTKDHLNQWIPSAADLNAYLLEVRNLLLEEAENRIRASSITEAHAQIFRKLMLATAWQESCWRQYVVKNGKAVPLVSGSGDIGMLQINEKVWRGFYSPPKLSWDITYNVRAGSEILFQYMVNYALKQQEHAHGGDPSNLARAAYSAYNGGPSQVSRYRKLDVPAAHKKIDIAFWEKYQQIFQGQELAVTQCFGGQVSKPAADVPQVKQRQQPAAPKPVAKVVEAKRIEDVAWIRGRRPDHFTLQLAAMGSEQAVKEFIKQQQQPGSFAYYRKKQNGKDLFVAIYGSFASRADAQEAAARFAPLKPWIRDFGSIQQNITN
jgi:septal ring-binding cell division protein DamX